MSKITTLFFITNEMESDLLLMEFTFKGAIINLYGILILILLNANVALLLTEYTESS